MSSRIIRGDDRMKKISVTSGGAAPAAQLLSPDHIMVVEKQAFEQGYREGERIGKQMGERMVEATIKRYERSIQDLAVIQRDLAASMEKETVQLALAITRKIIQRETVIDPDLVSALVSVALKRTQGHQSVSVRVSQQDFERVQSAVSVANGGIVVKEDPSLERGDFIVDTLQTHVDGRLSTQIETVSRALFDE
jgi:flagellar assembly protein FliH